MDKITKDELMADAKSLKLAIDDNEVAYFLEEVNSFIAMQPVNLNLDDVLPMRYANDDVVNVFSLDNEELVAVDDLMSNVKSREGNYIKVPKILK